MARQPDGPPPPPAVQKLRIRYAKRGRLRFTSVRDFQRSFERALRRAGVPMAFSAGFSPHPKISYANAAPTGTASEAEYVEISVVEHCDVEKLRAGVDAALPPGLDVVEVVEAQGGNLADRLEASVWELTLPGVSEPECSAAVRAFLRLAEVPVQRLTKNGLRTFDARSAVVSAVVRPGEPDTDEAGSRGSCAILRLVVRHGAPSVRPDDVLTGLRLVADLVPPVPSRITRLAQGPLNEADGTVGDPLAADRQPSGQEGETPGLAAADTVDGRT
jgi:radical SAM-linked protein